MSEAERAAQGWERRFVADAARAAEAAALYEAMGFEVIADPLEPQDLREGCEACRLPMLLNFRKLYTRPRDWQARAKPATFQSRPDG